MKLKEVTKHQFLRIYFTTVNANNPKHLRLSPNEIKVIIALMLKDEGKLQPVNPFHGEGREGILRDTNLASSTYSTCLKKLAKKGFLIKGEQDYALNQGLVSLLPQIGYGREVNISNRYHIVHASNLPKGSQETKLATRIGE